MKRIGIIGAGSMGKYHAQRWQQLPVELAGFYDTDRAASLAAAQQFGGSAFETLSALLDAVDLVAVTTPTHTHHAVVMTAAAAGKDIFCEKPMARHLTQCQEMIDACQASGSRLFIGQVVRFFPEFAQAKRVLDAGQIGKPGVIRTTRGGAHPTSSSWYADYEKSGGVVLDLAVHDLDYVRWCGGEVERVFSRGLSHQGLALRDYALILLHFQSGAIGHIEASWAYPPGVFFTKLEIAGDGGLLEFDSRNNRPLQTCLCDLENQTSGLTIPESPLAPRDDPYYKEDKHFLECVESDMPFAVQPADGMAAVRLALAANESMRTGQPVNVATFEEAPA